MIHVAMWRGMVAGTLFALSWSSMATTAQGQKPVQKKPAIGASDSVARAKIRAAAVFADSALLAQQRSIGAKRLLMPSLIDSTEASARRILSLLNSPLVVSTQDTQAPQRDARVFRQSPQPGQPLPPRTDTVRLWVYRYVPQTTVRVPLLIGRTLSDALRLLDSVKLTPRTPRLTRGDVARAVVTDQSPAPLSTVDAGTSVTLSVQVPTVVPRVIGLEMTRATLILTNQGLQGREVASEYDDSIPAGRIARQHPDPRTPTVSGAIVELWLSQGPHPVIPTQTMPLLVGRTLTEALDTIQGRKLTRPHVDTIEDAARAGRVVSQTPGAGAAVHETDAISIQIARAPALRRVPFVVGMSRASAARALQDAGFRSLESIMAGDPGTRDQVIAQKPDSGTTLLLGRPVAIVISDAPDSAPPTPRVMIDVVGERLATARAMLGELSPIINVVERATADSTIAGVVIAQSPDEGELVQPGVDVVLTVTRFERVQPPDTVSQRDPPPVQRRVPSLTGQSIADARRLLATVGLALGEVVSVTVVKDSVVATQTPTAGTLVAAATLVAVTLRTQGLDPRDPDRPMWWIWVIAGGAVVAFAAYRLLTPKPPDNGPSNGDPPATIDVTLREPPPELPRVDLPDNRSLLEYEITLVPTAPEVSIQHDGPIVRPMED